MTAPLVNVGWIGGFSLSDEKSPPFDLDPDALFAIDLSEGSIPQIDQGDGLTVHTIANKTITDYEQIVRYLATNELPVFGMRRVRNLIEDSSEVFLVTGTAWALTGGATQTGDAGEEITFPGVASSEALTNLTAAGLRVGEYRYSVEMRLISGTGKVRLSSQNSTDGNTYSGEIQLTSEWVRYCTPVKTLTIDSEQVNSKIQNTAGADDGVFQVRKAQLEYVTGQYNQAPGAYVSVGVEADPWQGLNVDGIQSFNTDNRNSVASDTVTEIDGKYILHDKLAGMLFGEGTSNHCTYTEDFSTTGWSHVNITYTANDLISPDGLLTADKLEDNNAAGYGIATNDITYTMALDGIFTYSCNIAKDGIPRTTRAPCLRVGLTGGNVCFIEVSLDTKTGETNHNVSAGACELKRHGALDMGKYWRVWGTFKNTTAEGNTVAEFKVYPAWTNAANWAQTSAAVGSIHAWGAMFSGNAAITPYLPNLATGSVTAGQFFSEYDIANWDALTTPFECTFLFSFMFDRDDQPITGDNQIGWQVVSSLCDGGPFPWFRNLMVFVDNDGILRFWAYDADGDSVLISSLTDMTIRNGLNKGVWVMSELAGGRKIALNGVSGTLSTDLDYVDDPQYTMNRFAFGGTFVFGNTIGVSGPVMNSYQFIDRSDYTAAEIEAMTALT
jgi:hypothetical protein